MFLETSFYSTISEVCIESKTFKRLQGKTAVETYIFTFFFHGWSRFLFGDGITERLALECTVRHHRLPTIEIVHLVVKVTVVVERLVIVRTGQHRTCTYRNILVQFRVDREVTVVTSIFIGVHLHHTFLVQIAQRNVVIGLAITTIDCQAMVLLWRPVFDVLVVPVPSTDKEHAAITEFKVTTQFHFRTELVTKTVLFPISLHLLDMFFVHAHITHYIVISN